MDMYGYVFKMCVCVCLCVWEREGVVYRCGIREW